MTSIRRSAAMGVIVTATAGLLAGSGIMATSANASTAFLGGLTANNPIASTVPGNGTSTPTAWRSCRAAPVTWYEATFSSATSTI
jgi:hypothetical protein